MKKSKLIELIHEYDQNHWKFRSYNERILLLKEFLNSPEIKDLFENESISFKAFEKFLLQKKLNPKDIFNEEYLNSNAKSTKLFKAFIDTKDDEEHSKLYLPKDLIQSITSYLPDQDYGRLAQTSIFHHRQLRNDPAFHHRQLRNNPAFYIRKLISLGCPVEFIDELKSSKIVFDYAQLSRNFEAFKKFKNPFPLEYSWQLFLISGLTQAFQYVTDKHSPDIKDDFDNNILHYAFMFGNQEVLDSMLNKKIPINSKNIMNMNIFHLAASFGNLTGMRVAVKHGIEKSSIDEQGRNALHHAAMNKQLEAMKEAIKLGLKPHTVTARGANIVNLSIGSLACVIYSIDELKVDPTLIPAFGCSPLHQAALEQDIETILYLRGLGLNPKLSKSYAHPERLVPGGDHDEEFISVVIKGKAKEAMTMPLSPQLPSKLRR